MLSREPDEGNMLRVESDLENMFSRPDEGNMLSREQNAG
jgi:hypothetical protein